MNRIMVHARLRVHLEALKARFGELLGDCDVKEYVGTDYAFRMFVPKKAWSNIVKSVADETDYDNFKSEVASHEAQVGSAYERALHDVWSVMYKLQTRRSKPTA